MLILTLGTCASASTWTFNVVRQLLAICRPQARSHFAEQGALALRSLDTDTEDAVFKAHFLDEDFIKLLLLAQGKVIVTRREPKDVIVSQRERFDEDEHKSIKDLSRTLACLASLPSGIRRMDLFYEDRFFDRVDTVKEIAGFVGLDVSDTTARNIWQSLLPEKVRDHIAPLDNGFANRSATGWDEATHWHLRHLGDGITGKWKERLPLMFQAIASGALDTLACDDRNSIFWDARSFTANGQQISEERVSLVLDGSGRTHLWGPYLHLPIGRWRIRPRLSAPPGSRISLRMEACAAPPPAGPAELRTIALPGDGETCLHLDIDVTSYTHPIEFRILSTDHGRPSIVDFAGVELSYLGRCVCDRPPLSYPVGGAASCP